MDFRQLLVGTLAGGVVMMVAGYALYELVWPMLFAPPAALEGERSLDYVSLSVGHLLQGALLSYIFLQWARIRTFNTGAIAGTIITLLAMGGNMLVVRGSDSGDIGTVGVAEILVHLLFLSIMGAITGGVVGWVLGQFPYTDSSTD